MKCFKNPQTGSCSCADPSKGVVKVVGQQAPKRMPDCSLILVLYTGGTIGMQPNEDDGEAFLRKKLM